MRKDLANKQVSVKDVLRIAHLLEDEKNEWLRKSEEESDRVDSIEKEKRTYESYTSSFDIDITYEDGRTYRDKSLDWFTDNIVSLEGIDFINMDFNMQYYNQNLKTNSAARDYHEMYSELGIHINYYSKGDKIDTRVTNNSIEEDAEMLRKQMNEVLDMNVVAPRLQVLFKLASLIEGYKNEMDMKARVEKNRIDSTPEVKKEFRNLKAEVTYEIVWLDGMRNKENYIEWFESNVENVKNIDRIYTRLDVYYWDDTNEKHECKSISANVDFYPDERAYCSSVEYDVSSDSLNMEADALYNKIENCFRECPVRYDSVIKYKSLRVQLFSIAVGAILSYIIYFAFKGVLSGNELGSSILANKNIIVFGQWVLAVIAGNVFGRWYLEMQYKPMMPRSEYAGYDRTNHKSVYKYNIPEYTEKSEVQLGKMYDFAKRRETIKLLNKYSLVVIAIQVIASIVLYMAL